MTADRIWILGASDPEMERIERLLRGCGERVEFATVWRDGVRRRVTPAEAYAPDVEIGAGLRGLRATAYMVECAPAVLVGSSVDGIDWSGGVVKIDHHRPGDPGYGRPPEDFMAASSIGQVIAELARLERPPYLSGVIYDKPGNDAPELGEIRAVLDPDCEDCEDCGDDFCCFVTHCFVWCVRVSTVLRRHPGGAYGEWAPLPENLVLCAAADHCLGAAYRGECPGVDPDELMRWRVESRAAFQRRPVEEVLADVEAAREALRRAKPISLTARPNCTRCNGSGMYYDAHGDDSASGQQTEDGYAVCPCGGYEPQWAADLRGQHVPELPEASARDGECFIADGLPGPDGRVKIVCQSGTREEIEAFMRVWAPARGLVDVYGDPARGFAGGYLP